MATDLTALASSSSTAFSLSSLILVTPDDNIGIKSQLDKKSFLFDFEGENSVSLESDITDHVVENNSTIQDQISLKPEIINTNGYVGELNDIPPLALQRLRIIADKLTLLAPFAPQLSISALEAYNTAAQLSAASAAISNAAITTWTSSQGSGTDPNTGLLVPAVQNKQQLAFLMFYGYWKKRSLFTVQTPWAIFSDMAIKSCTPTQDEDSRVISNFKIVFKKIKFAKTTNTRTQSKQARRSTQGKVLSDNGNGNTSPGQPLDGSIISSGSPGSLA